MLYDLVDIIGSLRWQAGIKATQAKELLTLSNNSAERADDFRRSELLRKEVAAINHVVDVLNKDMIATDPMAKEY